MVLRFSAYYLALVVLWCRLIRYGALHSNPARVTMKNTIGEDGKGNHLVKSIFQEIAYLCYGIVAKRVDS